MSVTLINEVRKKEAMGLKIGWKERLKNVTGGNNQELMESLSYRTKAIMIRVEGEGILKPRLPPSFPPETQAESS